jgi:hypothetical protein
MVFCELAGDERFTSGSARSGTADADLGGVQAQGDAFGGGVAEHVSQGAQPGSCATIAGVRFVPVSDVEPAVTAHAWRPSAGHPLTERLLEVARGQLG